jgi:hypothetical protein
MVENTDWTVLEVAQSFADQPEYQQIYGTGQSREQLVSQTYLQLFGRQPDDDGFNYWVEGGGLAVPDSLLIQAFYNGASEADQSIVDNKVEVSNYYTDNMLSYDQADAREVVSNITHEASTVDDAISMIDSFGDNLTLPPINDSDAPVYSWEQDATLVELGASSLDDVSVMGVSNVAEVAQVDA